MWIKICANTCAEDAVEAAELGADAVGFVFAPSMRQVTPQQARAIAKELPAHIERIGVFGTHSAQQIASAAQTARLTGVQLHCGFDRALTEELSELLAAGVSIVQAVHWVVDAEGSASEAVGAGLDRLAMLAPGGRVLVDAKVRGTSGGMGKSFPWPDARAVFSRHRGLPLILAGGLQPENVAEAICLLKPWGVDVASGVEREPGRKDFTKLRRFIENARGA